MYPPIYEYFLHKKVLLVGFGREGQSTHRYIRSFLPDFPLTIADRNEITPPDAYTTCICGEQYLDCIGDYDLVLKSPGISFKQVEVGENTEVTCQVDLFLRFANCHKIGVTGSKGKTTTSTLCYQFLQAAGKDSRLIGNIGVPVFETLADLHEDTVAVIEMSSHQLEFTKASPEVAILTNLYEEHLEHYKGGFTGYARAKSHIALYQKAGDLFLYNGTQGMPQCMDFSAVPSFKQPIYVTDSVPFSTENEHLLGVHNYQDILFARAATARFGVTDADCARAIAKYEGIEHRMEKVGTWKGVTFYNDCIATIPHAVFCAVDALKCVDTLIFGGMDRGLDYREFVRDLEKSPIQNLIGTPDTGHVIVDALLKNGSKKHCVKAPDLDAAVKEAYACTQPGSICLLSPAASSYNVYRNFEEKGRHYKTLIQKYGRS